jgi:acetyltransferase-like isoleucine patch superfamily enzyme
MFGLVTSILTAARLYLMRRRQYDNAQLRRYFSTRHGIDVGQYSYGCFDRWRMPGPMRVGRYCSISSTTRSVLSNHPTDSLTTHPALYERSFGVVEADLIESEPLVIEDDVWIGHGAIILPGCKLIGRGALIGAGAIVTKNVDRYAVVAGNPARKLRDRFAPDLIAAIEASRWWEMELDDLRQLVRERPQVVFHPSVEALAAWKRPD